ncbi:SIR2 family NAD-dependent protein deacylase [Pseudoduganella umbonata]|uniref:protein acetyllysine N-acetyltransferase n=1 Tax=Pseudoduganella umbonata TaxID=864828 RepID=A0A4P8HQ10_9BURK|nr:Sir2 family NAD-dependent protein deacetylase [Pseudoduganella umbonata]MBB3224426.1 NAD-dependent SIR2 family protein deacetylase [Pseudoduganella umbonata]QCP11216.1 NAD-dependent deacetylase [Pseudoduganella umbonata]
MTTPSSPTLLDNIQLERAAEIIRQADALIVAAGAGIGVDSGLPDFRGNEGFWRAYPALGAARIAFTTAASPATFEENPNLAWGFYGHRLNLYRDTMPHDGFRLLKTWGEKKPHGYHVFTSNVDGQFQKAGFDAGKVHECHGSIHYLQCLEPCTDAIWEADAFTPEVDAQACRLTNEAPRCLHCGGLARPNILMFGDWGWIEERSERQAARLARWLEKVERPVVIELGAGTAIPSVRRFSEEVIRRGGRLVRINPREPKVPTPLDAGLAAGALEGLSAIAARL